MDIRQFHAAFFEESREGLAAMEDGLLALESGAVDAETINVIFRAAHSIKGGAATFGFTAITDLTHLLETLLDEARSGRRALGGSSATTAVAALLESVDVLRDLLAAAELGTAIDAAALGRVRSTLVRILGETPVPAGVEPREATGLSQADWKIGFRPAPSLFVSGNDPLRILRELGELGEVQATCLDDRLPPLAQLDPYEAYLAWDLRLPGDASRGAIEDAFAWVEDQCELIIERVAGDTGASPGACPPGAVPVIPRIDPDAPLRRASDSDNSIRVAIDKVDALVNLVGELVITQAMLRQRSELLDPTVNAMVLAGLEQLDRNTRDLQDAVLGVRMLPVEFAFNRFPRMVRDLASRLGKKVRLRTHGEGTELDKGVIEKIVDPLVHLVRNAIDHGLETPAERLLAGKDDTGTLTLKAAHQNGHIVLEISDDGRGLDRERILRKAIERDLPFPDNPTDAQVWDLVFHPGFSTVEQLTDLSGRGVGMDVVRKNIASLGGQVEIRSRSGAGTTVSIRLPLTLAILDGMTIAVGNEVFILPLSAVVESLQPTADDVRTIAGETRLLRVRDDYLPLIDLARFYGLPVPRSEDGAAAPRQGSIAVVVESDGQRLALQVDALVGQQQVVVKNLETNYRRVAGVSGATILGDGRVALIIDAAGLADALRMPAAA
jgi:two-component system chemotaxis sensor kinase CheA